MEKGPGLGPVDKGPWGLGHRGHAFAPKVRFPGFVFAVCPIGGMYSPQKFDFRDLYLRLAPLGAWMC